GAEPRPAPAEADGTAPSAPPEADGDADGDADGAARRCGAVGAALAVGVPPDRSSSAEARRPSGSAASVPTVVSTAQATAPTTARRWRRCRGRTPGRAAPGRRGPLPSAGTPADGSGVGGGGAVRGVGAGSGVRESWALPVGSGAREFGALPVGSGAREFRSEEHTSELQSRENLVCRLLLEKK